MDRILCARTLKAQEDAIYDPIDYHCEVDSNTTVSLYSAIKRAPLSVLVQWDLISQTQRTWSFSRICYPHLKARGRRTTMIVLLHLYTITKAWPPYNVMALLS